MAYQPIQARARGPIRVLLAPAVALFVILGTLPFLAAVPAVATSESASSHGPAKRPQGGVIWPASGALFGAATFANERRGWIRWQADQTFEALIGRPMTLERVYFSWDQVFPGANEYLARDLGRTLILSWGAGLKKNGSVVPWKDIAAGKQDAVIDARAADLKAFAAPLIFVFHHEPNGKHPAGTPQEFIAAYQHIHDRFISDGVTNLTYGIVMFDTAFDMGTIDDYYPGDSYVDVVGVDAYNWYACPGRNDPWESFQTITQSFHDFIVAHGKPGIVAEWGSNEDPADPGRKAQWFVDATATLKSWPEVKGVSYFDSGPPANTCNWWVDSSTETLAAFQAMGADPYFNPPWPPPLPTNLTYVNSPDNDFSPVNGYPAVGNGVKWLFQGPSNHSVTDSSGMGYFASGSKVPGTNWSFTFVAAGNYAYKCVTHTMMLGTVKVPISVVPTSGTLTTVFTVTWASKVAPTGYVYDVQILRPGASWVNWLKGITTFTSTFLPDGGVGAYTFRSRLRKLVPNKAAGWSDGLAVTVS